MTNIKERAHSAAWQIFEEIGLSKHSVDRMSEIIAENISEQKAIDIDNACIILCRYACPYKIDSNKCLNAKCDNWEMFRRMMDESTNQHYAKDIKFFLTLSFIKTCDFKKYRAKCGTDDPVEQPHNPNYKG